MFIYISLLTVAIVTKQLYRNSDINFYIFKCVPNKQARLESGEDKPPETTPGRNLETQKRAHSLLSDTVFKNNYRIEL